MLDSIKAQLPRVWLQVQLAVKNLARQRKRSVLALTTVSGGVMAFLLAGGFIHWIFQDLREATIHSQLGHVQITRPGYLDHGLGDPYKFLLPSRLDGVPQDPRIVTTTPRLAFSGLLSKGEETISFLGEGIDPVKEASISRAITIVKGKALHESPPLSVSLGEGLASNLGATVGDRVVLMATTSSGSVNAVELTVTGIFATITKAYDDAVLRAPIDVARKLMRVEGATTWVVLLSKTDDTRGVVAFLRQGLDPKAFEIIPWSDLADFYNKTVELFSKQVGVVRLLIALIVILSISNTLTMSVIERTNEIGTSMAIGVRRKGILGMFILEGVILGVVGGVIGVAGGMSLGALISHIGIPMPPPPGMARGYIGEILISPALAMDGFLLAFLTTLLASVFPAWKASRMNIVDALRHQQ